MVERPRIAGGAKVGDVASAADGELVEIGLGEDDGAGRAQPCGQRRIAMGDVMREGQGAGGGSYPGVNFKRKWWKTTFLSEQNKLEFEAGAVR